MINLKEIVWILRYNLLSSQSSRSIIKIREYSKKIGNKLIYKAMQILKKIMITTLVFILSSAFLVILRELKFNPLISFTPLIIGFYIINKHIWKINK